MFIRIISVYKRFKDKLVSDTELESKIYTQIHTHRINIYIVHMGFSCVSDGKESALCRRLRFNLWVRKILWKGNGYPLRYSSMENPIDRGDR